MPRFLSVTQGGGNAPRPIHGVLMGTTARRLVVSSLSGLRPDGTMPEGLDAQAGQAFDNLAALVAASGLRLDDIVSVAAYVSAAGAKAVVHRTAGDKLGGFRPVTAVRQVVSLSQAGSEIELDAEVIGET